MRRVSLQEDEDCISGPYAVKTFMREIDDYLIYDGDISWQYFEWGNCFPNIVHRSWKVELCNFEAGDDNYCVLSPMDAFEKMLLHLLGEIGFRETVLAVLKMIINGVETAWRCGSIGKNLSAHAMSLARGCRYQEDYAKEWDEQRFVEYKFTDLQIKELYLLREDFRIIEHKAKMKVESEVQRWRYKHKNERSNKVVSSRNAIRVAKQMAKITSCKLFVAACRGEAGGG